MHANYIEPSPAWGKKPADSDRIDGFAQPAEPQEAEGILATIKRFTDAASLLRMAGAVTVVAAMSAFLLQDWSGNSDTERFYLLLAQTVLLALGGLGLSYGMKENKGARVFLGLSLLSITANMATLGALIFSVTQWSGSLAHYPSIALWKTSPGELGLAMGAGALVFAPIALFAFLVLARRSAKELALLFFATNLLMVLPIRGTSLVGVVAMLAVLVPLSALPSLMRKDTALRTLEGYFAMAALFAPAIIVISRSFMLYQIDDVTQMLLAGTGYALLRSPVWNRDGKGLGFFGGAFSSALAALVVHPFADVASFGSSSLFYALFGLAFAGFGIDIAQRSAKHEKLFALFAGLTAAVSVLIPLVTHGTTLESMLFVAAGLGVVAMSRHFQHGTLFLLGAAMVVVGVLYQLHLIVAVVNFSNWATLAFLGTSAIVSASVIERHGPVLKLKYDRLKHSVIREFE